MRNRVHRFENRSTVGFTLIETLIVVAIVGILMVMTGPVWIGLFSAKNLNVAQNQAYQLIRTAQSEADRARMDWQAAFRNANGNVEAATHPAYGLPSNWEVIATGVSIDPAETTLALASGIYRVQFNHKNGRVNGQLGRITFANTSGGNARRCVIVSTLLGELRKGQTQATADSSGRFCY